MSRVTNKQIRHYKSILQEGLDKFVNSAKGKKADKRYNLIIGSWKALINSEERIRRYGENITNVDAVFGFSRNISVKLSYDELIGRAAQGFAELDLAEHIIREFNLEKRGVKLEKLVAGNSKRCEFRLSGKTPYYFESKYTSNIRNINQHIREGLDQIAETMTSDGAKGKGCIWVFTYEWVGDSIKFQKELEKIKKTYSSVRFEFNLNVQVYRMGLFGDATVI